MNRRVFFSVTALALLGCGEADPCERAIERIERKSEECSIYVDEGVRDDIQADSLECSAEQGEELTRQADCMENASCKALDGSDTTGAQAFAACMHAP